MLATHVSIIRIARFRNLPCKRIQADEIWSFVYSKQKNVPEEKRGQFGYGDVWTWTAHRCGHQADRLLARGTRDATRRYAFMIDLASRLTNRVQLTTDGHARLSQRCGRGIRAAKSITPMLVKKYGTAPEAEKRYSPPICLGADAKRFADARS